MKTVLLIGLGPTALSAFESLRADLTVVGIVRTVHPEASVTRPGRDWSVTDLDNWVPGRQLGDPAEDIVLKRANELGIPVYSDTSVRELERVLAQLRPDCAVVSSYHRILSPAILGLAKFVNVHYTPLPKYRGRGMWALVNGEPSTAITIHALAADLDAGNTLFQQSVPISGHDTVADLYTRLNELQQRHLGQTVLRFLDGYAGTPQRQDAATYGCSSDCDCPEDGEIDWSASTAKIDCLIRGFTFPFLGAHTYVKTRRLTIWRAHPAEDAPYYAGRVPGRVVAVSRSTGFVDVLTGDGTLRVTEVQEEGGEKVPPTEIIRSVSDTLGLRTCDLLDRINALERQIALLLDGQRRSA